MFINGYYMTIILVAIGGYSIGGYWWLLIFIILVTIGGYYINGYWWILVDIGGYWWLLM